VIDNMMLDVCSICVDECEIHDKVQILPCHHTFHSKCVGRWFSEQSAVCPLCKEGLYVEPEPFESEQETTATNTKSPLPPTPEHHRVGQKCFHHLHLWYRKYSRRHHHY
jgi:hypothetical protein